MWKLYRDYNSRLFEIKYVNFALTHSNKSCIKGELRECINSSLTNLHILVIVGLAFSP